MTLSPGGRLVAYVAHPLGALTAAGLRANRKNAGAWVRHLALSLRVAPVATWITLSEGLSEEHRAWGLSLDCDLVRRSDLIILCGGVVSSGMQAEANAARAAGVPIVDLTALGRAVPPGHVTRAAVLECIPAHWAWIVNCEDQEANT